VLRVDWPPALNKLVLGSRERIAGTVYGTIVVLASLTAGASANEHDLWQLDAILGVSVLVLWVAHVYAHGLGESLDSGRRLTAAELGTIARRQFSIPLAAVLPMTAIALGALNVFQDRTALWLALGAGVATLTAQGVRYAQLEHLSRKATIVTVGLNLVFGLVIVVLKAVVAH
jgi:membrane-associated PAP2 superfamily phosphatase